MNIFRKLSSSVLTRPVLEIDFNKMLLNYKLLKELCAPAVAAAVIKDDAYGVGAKEVVRVLYEKAGCSNFFAAHAFEALEVLEFAPDAKFYILQGIGDDSLPLFQKYGFVPVISSPEMLSFYKKHRKGLATPMIQIETGLNRLGFRESDLKKLSQKDLKMFSGVMSHLAAADECGHFMNAFQLNNFKRLKEKYFKDLPASLSASDGVFLGEEFCFDMVRLGAALYGINTAPYRQNQMQNIVTLKAPVLQVTDLKKGEFVGYSATYRASANRKIAIVSVGYGDGVPRSLSNVGKVYFKQGLKWGESRILGRVSMDNIICDVTDLKDIEVGQFGFLIFDEYTLDDMARDAGTIAYEVLSCLGKGGRAIKKYL